MDTMPPMLRVAVFIPRSSHSCRPTCGVHIVPRRWDWALQVRTRPQRHAVCATLVARAFLEVDLGSVKSSAHHSDRLSRSRAYRLHGIRVAGAAERELDPVSCLHLRKVDGRRHREFHLHRRPIDVSDRTVIKSHLTISRIHGGYPPPGGRPPPFLFPSCR